MTVSVHAIPPGGDIRAMAASIVAREVRGRADYPGDLIELAEASVIDFFPAYVVESSSATALNTAKWAMGGLYGSEFDPPYRLRGIRDVADWRAEHMQADEFRAWLLTVLRDVRPINAMAQLDRELLMGERGISEKEVRDV